MSGAAVSAGIAIGTAIRYGTVLPSIEERRLSEDAIDAEIQRFRAAVGRSQSAVTELRDRVAESVASGKEGIFEAHLLLLSDPALIARTEAEIRERRCNAEAAFRDVVEANVAALGELDDPYIRDRLVDIRDVGSRVLNQLLGREDIRPSMLSEPAIVVAEDLSPSDTADLDRENILGVVTAMGSRTSHTAIMTRALGIPAVVGVGREISRIPHGASLIVDGTRGVVTVNPDEAGVAEARQRLAGQARWNEQVRAEIDLPAETRDGFRVRLAANIELPHEVVSLKRECGVGIGLFRTEYLFVGGAALSDEESQFEEYRRVAQEILPRSVIFRTLDIGGDKFMSHVAMPTELNPFLGMRAIRFCLSQPDIFRAQLRAVLRASAYGKVRIMFPMIATVDELLQSLEILQEVKDQLARGGVPHNPHLDVGMMVEIPSAALLADQLAPHVDFFSLGTNDLVQYALAADRANPDIRYLYQPTHPAVIRMMRNVVDAAYANGIWVSLCGEMAADPLLVPLVLGLGIHELSMSPVAIGLVKRLVRNIRMSDAEDLVEGATACARAAEVLALCRDYLAQLPPGVLPTR